MFCDGCDVDDLEGAGELVDVEPVVLHPPVGLIVRQDLHEDVGVAPGRSEDRSRVDVDASGSRTGVFGSVVALKIQTLRGVVALQASDHLLHLALQATVELDEVIHERLRERDLRHQSRPLVTASMSVVRVPIGSRPGRPAVRRNLPVDQHRDSRVRPRNFEQVSVVGFVADHERACSRVAGNGPQERLDRRIGESDLRLDVVGERSIADRDRRARSGRPR